MFVGGGHMMKILHVNAGAEVGGGKTHIISLLSQFRDNMAELLVFEEGEISEEAKKRGIKTHIIEQKSRYDISVLHKIILFINSGKFDIVHTHGARANFFMSIIRNKLEIKWVTTVHSDPTLDFMKRGLSGFLFTKLNLSTYRKMDGIFAVSEFFREKLISFGIPSEKIRTIHNGIVYSSKADTSANINELRRQDIFTLVYVARLHPVKGHDILFKAIQNSKIPQLKLLLVGSGPIAEDLKVMVHEMNLEDQVTFLGHREDVEELLATADVNILTSHSESFPLVLLEGANQRIPCITTDVGDVKLLIPDKSYGWVVPVGDDIAISEAIQQAYNIWLKGTLPIMGEKLYNHAAKNFSLQKLYEGTVRYYQELLAK